MIPWIQVYSNLPRHPKVATLADLLNLKSKSAEPESIAVGLLVGLWCWAIQNAYEGDLSGCTARVIAKAAGWTLDPSIFVTALIKAGFLDDDGRLHDWEEYAALLISAEQNRKENDRKRAEEYRKRKRDASRDDHVTEA